MGIKIVGIDLAGSERRKTGCCIICIAGRRMSSKTMVLHTDEEIIRIICENKPCIVAIDAPLSLPHGRDSIDKKSPKHFRECDIMLREKGIRFFPITLGPMRMLTKRGMNLKKKIQRLGIASVIEVFPGATYDVFGVGRRDKKGICAWARKLGLPANEGLSQDELDAIACAITALLYLQGMHECLKGRDGEIVLPCPPALLRKNKYVPVYG
ncbi:MAG: DUF429 domain-containing protein [Candidatus Micrarchaeia archaeon]